MSSMVRDVNSPVYARVVARIMPLIMGPRVCPMSIMVFKKPMDVPIKFGGVSSHIKGAVEEITRAKPMLYPMDMASSRGNCVVNGTLNRRVALVRQPKMMGMRRLYLSDKRPSRGLKMIKDMACIPITVDTASALRFAISIMYWTR